MNLRKFYTIMTVTVAFFLFLSGIGVIYYFNTSIVADVAAISPDNPIDKLFEPFKQNKEPFNLLLLGGDKVNKNSDTMMLANFDPSTYKVNIMSIPRDTRVVIEDEYRKINYAYPRGGIDLTIKTVSELMDVKIKYYVFVDTKAFRKIIDLLGGVKLEIYADMDYDDPTQNLHIHLKKGMQNLNGDKAEQFVRFRDPNRWTKEIRKYYDGSDLKRIEAQQRFMSELVRQKLSIQYLPKLNSIISVLFDNIETNLTMNEVVKLSGYAGKISMDSLNFIPMPGTTYDGSPWYYLCDIPGTRAIMAESFKGNDSFVTAEKSNDDAYAEGGKGSSVPKPPKPTVKKDNPSNEDSSLKGEQKPSP